MKLSFPILFNDSELHAWKALLNVQDQLSDLKLEFLFYLLELLFPNHGKLLGFRHLDLSLSNYPAYRSPAANWFDAIDFYDAMSWTELLSDVQELRSLKIFMSNAYPKSFDHSQTTTKLLNLELNYLLKLDLSFVSHGLAELSHIFQNISNLTNLKISYFSTRKTNYLTTIKIIFWW